MPPGCLAALILLGLLFMVPFFFTHAMLTALARLGLSPDTALLALIGIFLGGAVNIPVKRVEREEDLEYDPFRIFGLDRILPSGWPLPFRRTVRSHMVIAVNLGGCLIPSAIALYEITRVAAQGTYALSVLVVLTGVNILVCYLVARPIPNVGIAMPPLVPVLVAVLPSLVFVPGFAPPVAFTAGVLGPLIGADLLHLKDISRMQTGILSIGGAGTFDGIVLSGMFAALLA
ncbi:MAG: DUF1614 domain-containing protein [Candidatus Aminicenantales bacterium]